MDSLRAVTRADVETAIATATGNSPHNVHTALRSLFRALKRERVIFADPARHVTGHFARKLPMPLPTDRLRGLLDRTHSSRARLAAALVAVHALHIEQLRHLLLADLDRPRGRLVVGKPDGAHRLFLDELCLTLATQCLNERGHRWPATANPHLLVSQQTAVDPTFHR
jgi:hypothetical protein